MIVTTSLLVQSSSVCVSLQLYSLRILVFIDSCKEPIEPLSIEEVAERCHAPEDLEVIYKIIAHMAANERALIAEGNWNVWSFFNPKLYS
ncbi:glucose-6-phosphate isomerase 1, chloroplastic-like isoform X3 [Vicia villosa]|uniref:glucose-6-phosphate isomerase 1, chloroplastic-like isoform X3 n=1 Tax=Vicia villosa TaxID=3911 RepID=UPI00273A8808|nr:glucose-6-phosphate isomerase 1, chloroplastic-like isoform X3 [Vicia villosa]XP_058730290.1 glucose-6-phosphate isomerase 1, chloroplastic-like isoform X3 [Vicia villosa]